MPQFSIRVSDQLLAKLDAYAKTKKVPRSAAVRAFLNAGVGSGPIQIAVDEAIALLSERKTLLFGTFQKAFATALRVAISQAFDLTFVEETDEPADDLDDADDVDEDAPL